MADQFNNERPNLTSRGNFSRQSLSGKPEIITQNTEQTVITSAGENNTKQTLARGPIKNLSTNPTIPTTSVLDKETVVMVGEDKKKDKNKKKKSKLWLKILIFILMIVLFLSSVGVGIFAVTQIVAQRDKYKTTTNIKVLANDGIEYTLYERIYTDENSGFELNKVSNKDMKFKWVNQNKKIYELQIVYDRTKTLRFRHYNLFNSLYTKEKLFDVDYVSNNINFDSKFYLAEDDYYYFDNNSQSGNKLTLVFSVEFNIDEYRGQFDGMTIDEVFEFEQSSNPEVDWGYYSYLIVK